MEINEYIKKWSEKLSLTEPEIQKDYNKLVTEEKEIHKESSEEDQQMRALQRLAMSFKKQLRSPAVGFEGCVIAVGDAIDTVAKIKREAKELYKNNPQKAIADGNTNEEGIPLDARKEWSGGRPNRNFGKPLPEHNWLRTVYGIALKTGIDESPKYFVMGISGEIATNEDIPIFKPVRFRAIDRTLPENVDKQYNMNSSMFTKFEIDESIPLPKPMELLKKYCGDMFVDMSNLQEYHDRMKDDYNRLVIVEGDISTLVLEPTSVGSRRIVLEDENKVLEDLEALGTTCWIPQRINIDFGEQSKVIILGRTGQGFKLGDDRRPTDEPGDIMINVFGLYALPEYKIQPQVKEITEENIETTEEEKVEEKPTTPEGGW